MIDILFAVMQVHLDHKHMGLGGDDSWSRSCHEKYLVPAVPYSFSIRFCPITSATSGHDIYKLQLWKNSWHLNNCAHFCSFSICYWFPDHSFPLSITPVFSWLAEVTTILKFTYNSCVLAGQAPGMLDWRLNHASTICLLSIISNLLHWYTTSHNNFELTIKMGCINFICL